MRLHRFTCGDMKIWKNIKKSQNVMKMIVDSFLNIGMTFASLHVLEKVPCEKNLFINSARGMLSSCSAIFRTFNNSQNI